MRTEKERHNDSLIVAELLGGLVVGLFTIGLPFMLWYLFKFIDFIKSEDFKLFLIGFSLCPLWIFIFLKIHKAIEKKKEKENEFFE